ncbi:MAG: hypothetical protein P1U36_00345 [Legionellaceae bacterium]|nr:hypothetical protein [Legionellaceae bacterium]
MPFLFRSERLSVLKQVHLDLERLKNSRLSERVGGFYSSETKLSGALNAIEISQSSHDPSSTDRDNLIEFYKTLESKLYASNLNDLDTTLDSIQENLLKAVDSITNKPFLGKNLGYSFLQKASRRAEITGSIFTPFWVAARSFENELTYLRYGPSRHSRIGMLSIILILPFIQNILGYKETRGGWTTRVAFKDEIISNLILSLLNPVKAFDSLLTCIKLGVNRLLDIGLDPNKSTPIPQAFLKGVVALVVTIIKIPLTILKPFGEIIPAVVNNLLIQPVKYIHGRLSTPTRHEHDLASSYEGSEESKGTYSRTNRLGEGNSMAPHIKRVRRVNLTRVPGGPSPGLFTRQENADHTSETLKDDSPRPPG